MSKPLPIPIHDIYRWEISLGTKKKVSCRSSWSNLNTMTIEPTSGPQNNTTSHKIIQVPLRTGPPTREELIFYYPAKFTWDQLKTFVNSGYILSSVERTRDTDPTISLSRDLGLLKRDRVLQKRYNAWSSGIIKEHGSMGR